MSKPFLTKTIERYGDTAMVKIDRIDWLEDGKYKRTELANYETLSRGATASARKEMKKLEAEGKMN